MELIQTTNLHFFDHKSDKVYYVELCKTPKSNLWNINFAYGKRDHGLIHGIKNKEPLPFSKAKFVYDMLVQSKVKKGYYHTSIQIKHNNRTRAYTSFALELMNEKYITENEYSTVTRMLYSNDPETVKLAEVLIETKEKLRWEQN